VDALVSAAVLVVLRISGSFLFRTHVRVH
jgi:hypothetical protein